MPSLEITHTSKLREYYFLNKLVLDLLQRVGNVQYKSENPEQELSQAGRVAA